MVAAAVRPIAIRGAATRDALLDAAERLIADDGFRTPSHRSLARAAGVHTALINYHFASKEMLFEAMVERRAARLNQEWQTELDALRRHGSFTPEDVLRAWWRPFREQRLDSVAPWRDYLCAIARLASAPDGNDWHQRYFGVTDDQFQRALQTALPGITRDDLETGFRYARSLFGEVLLIHCGKAGGKCPPRGFREDDLYRLFAYIAGGLRSLQQMRPGVTA